MILSVKYRVQKSWLTEKQDFEKSLSKISFIQGDAKVQSSEESVIVPVRLRSSEEKWEEILLATIRACHQALNSDSLRDLEIRCFCEKEFPKQGLAVIRGTLTGFSRNLRAELRGEVTIRLTWIDEEGSP